ncbi:hypothetical protein HQ584_00945 [Patescibacteria group bacterium]|nr:hypothetical protein [Patescibacteria group bacterium]
MLKKQYTADEIARIKQGFNANPLQYSQAAGDMLLWRMHQKSPEFALEFVQTPEIADGINAQEAKAMGSIYDLIKPIEITKGLYEKKESDSNVHKIIMEWEGNKESDWSGWFLGLGNTNYSSGKIVTANPINFEAEDVINQEYLRRYQDLKWKSLSGKGDTDGISFNLQSPMHKELTFYINGKQLKLTPVDLLKKDLVFDDKDGLDGKLTIKNGYQSNLTPELFAIREMVLAGEGEHRYSSPLQALLWGYMDGKFKEGDNPLENYQGALEFVKPIWGEMEGERWRTFEVVAERLNYPELVEFYLKTFFSYDGSLLASHMSTRWDLLALTPEQVFNKREGVCIDAANFACSLLHRAGYEVHTFTIEGYPRHTVGTFKDKAKVGVIGDTNSLGAIILFGSYEELSETLTGSRSYWSRIDIRRYGW